MQPMVHRIDRKIFILMGCLVLFFMVIIARLLYFQVILNEELQTLSQKNYLRSERTRSLRGNILDCNGNLLATNRPVTTLIWRGTGNRTLNTAQRHIITILEQIMSSPFDQTTLQAISRAEQFRKEIELCDDLSLKDLSKILEQFPEHQNIGIKTNFQRHYPYGQVASHILGYLGTITVDPQGKMGLEKKFEEILKGQEGTSIKTINSFGSPITQEEIQKAMKGSDIVTTVDLELQQILEEAFTNEYSGSCIIMDPYTGAIRAILSRPAFDPSLFLKPVSQETWAELQEHHTFLNRAFNACYPPASLFKLITVSAALELGIITTDYPVYCKGYSLFKGRKYNCRKRLGHGLLTVQEALAKSCNVLFFEIGKKISIDKLAQYARLFGLGEKTQDIFTEQAGLVPDTLWKKTVKREPWWPGETLSVAIGQSYLLATPIQIVRMIGCIFTGYLVKPRILMNEEIIREPLKLSKQTRKFLKRSMKSVVLEGSGSLIKSIRDIKVYAKTGTAQTSDLSKRDLGNAYLEHAWFVTHFKYKDKAPLSMVVLEEHTGSSQTAIDITKKILIRYRNYMQSKDEIARDIANRI